jgi:hypothetical protein
MARILLIHSLKETAVIGKPGIAGQQPPKRQYVPPAAAVARALFLVLLGAGSASAQFTAAPGGPVTVGSTPRSVAAGDFNGDGKPDFVTVSFNAGVVTLFLGNGSGGFTPQGPFAVGTNPQSVAAADFNGDGKPDLVTANFSGNSVTVLLNNGTGGFTATPGSPAAVGTSPVFVATGDFNGDGKLDIVTANSGDNSITVLLGDGSGGFTPAAGSPFAVGTNPQSVAAGDFNGDGALDIVAANAGDNTVTALLGDGSGGFTPAAGSPFAVGTNPQSVAVADFNGDGKLDIVVANSGYSTVTELLGDGTGGFAAAAGSPFAAGANPQSVAAADFNGDGNADIVVANSGSNTATVLFGNGTGGFTAATGGPFATGANPQCVAVADFNGDGKPDFITANFNSDSATVLLNSLPAITLNFSSLTFYAGAGQAAPASIPVNVSSPTAGSTYAASSKQPWLTPSPASNATGGATTVTLSASAASLAAGVYAGTVRYTAPNFFDAATAVTFSVANPSGGLQAAAGSPFALGATPSFLAAGDFNNDGNPDLVTSNTGDDVTVLLGDGTGGFTPAGGSPFTVGTNPQSVAVADFNGDGNLDLATANFGDNTVTILLGDGSGGFTPAAGSPFTVGTNPQSVAVADFNGDRNPDIVTANNNSNDLTVLLGNGTGGFEPAPGSPIAAGLFPQSVAVGDFNGDGKPDLVEANSGNNIVRLLLSNGAGGFTGGGAVQTGSLPHSVAVADFNGDGKLDVVAANYGSNTVTVLLGNGSGGLIAAAGSPFAVGVNPESVLAADINGDGRPDIVTANSGGNTITVLLGNGSGGFAAAAGSPFAAGTNPVSVVAADFIPAGGMDIAAADIGGGTITVLLGAQVSSSSGLSTTASSTVTYGTSVPLKLVVTGSFGTPAGTGTFLDGGVAIGTAIQTSSPFLFTATTLAVGSHTLTASYGGNSAYTSSTSNAISITVTQASQTITFSALSNHAQGGPPFTIDATASSGLAVGFTSTTPSVCTVSGATVTLGSPGTCTIQASQVGNGNYAPAPSVSQHFTVTPATSQTIAFGALSDQAFGTAPFRLSATASSGLAVTFTSTTLPVCTVSGTTVTLVSAGTCTIQAAQPGNSTYAPAAPVMQSFTVTAGNQTIAFGVLANQGFGSAPFKLNATASSGLAVAFASTTLPVCTVSGANVTLVSAGTCTIQASQAGNNNYAAATAVNQSFTVTQGSQTITFGVLANKPFGTPPFLLSATASSGLAVGFTSSTLPVCTVSGTTVTLVAVGTCTIQAAQPGNANYAAATAVSQHFTVTTASQTIAFGSIANTVFGTAPFALSATASSGLTVVFSSTTTAVCTVATATVTLVSAGTCSIQATQLGNTDYAAAAPVNQSFSVTTEVQTITFGSLSNVAFGAPPITITATASSGLAVSFKSSTSSVCTVATATSGTTVKLLSGGTCTIQASQAGNSEYAAAPPVTQSFTVTQEVQTITFGALANLAFGSSTITLSATASSGLAVAFASTTSSVCTVSTSAAVTLVSVGTCTIEASQPGNANYAPATPVDQSFTVTPASQTITFGALPNKPLGSAPFTVSATASSGLPVGFASNSGVCSVSGTTVTLAIGGTCGIQASQPGNADFNAATPVIQSFTVTPESQTISFAAVPSQVLGASPFAVNATASSNLAVGFTSTTPAVCTVSGGMVTLLTKGACTIQASQPGNSNYAPAPPVSQTFSVGAGVLTIGSVLNAGSYAAIPIASDECTVAFGVALATTTAQTNSVNLPKTLGGTTLTISDSTGVTQIAPLFYVSPPQINFLVPEGLAPGSATFTVTNAAGKKVSLPVTIARVAPSLFTADSSGAGAPAANALAYAPGAPSPQVTPTYICGGSPVVCTAAPIDVGSPSTIVYLELFGTGIRGRTGLSGVSVTLNGLAQQVTYAGAQGSYQGLDQINVLLSPSLAGSGLVTLQLTVDGVPANAVTLNIR